MRCCYARRAAAAAAAGREAVERARRAATLIQARLGRGPAARGLAARLRRYRRLGLRAAEVARLEVRDPEGGDGREGGEEGGRKQVRGERERREQR